MRPAALVLADVLQQCGIRFEDVFHPHQHRFGERFWIGECHLEFHVSKVAPVETLRDPKRLGLRMPAHIEPAPVIETHGLNHQRVAFPVSDRISQPCGIGILRKAPAICEDGSVWTVWRLMEHHDQVRSLDDPG